jgi:iron complex transport system ATP-binding protein
VLSQGERQRVLIGRALIANPQLLILDEPCAGLDPAAREQFVHFLDGLARKKAGPGLVLVTHHVEEITPAFTHVLGLREGKVSASGTVTEVLTSKNLGKLFDAPVELRVSEGRYTLDVRARARRAI